MKKNAQEASLIRQVQDLLEDRRFQEAIGLLATEPLERSSGELLALHGLVHFLLEKYEASVQHYQAAL